MSQRAPPTRKPISWAIQQVDHILLRPHLVRILCRSPMPSFSSSSMHTIVLCLLWTSRMIPGPIILIHASKQMLKCVSSTTLYLLIALLPVCGGLSLLGTSLRVYCGDVVTCKLEPAFESPGHTLSRNFFEGAWDVDILSQEGFTKMEETVGDIIGSAGVLDQA